METMKTHDILALGAAKIFGLTFILVRSFASLVPKHIYGLNRDPLRKGITECAFKSEPWAVSAQKKREGMRPPWR